MKIGPSQYEYLSGQLVGTSNGGAVLLSPDFKRLWDGRISTATRFQYFASGAQSVSSAWGIELFVAPKGKNVPLPVTVGMVLIQQTTLPPGAVVQIMDANILVGDLLGSGTMQLDQSGVTTGAVILFNNTLATGPIIVVFRNNDGTGGRYLTDGEVIEIGEIRVSESFDFELKRTPKLSWAAVNKQRFTSSGQSIPIPQPKIRTLQVDFAPIPQREAINNGRDDLMTVLGMCMEGNVACFVLSDEEDPALYGSPSFSSQGGSKLRAKTALIGNFSQAPNVVNAGDKYWDGTAAITESV